jgi:hypothetical protein
MRWTYSSGVFFLFFLWKFVTNLYFLYLSGFERCECKVVGSIIFGDNIFVVVRFRKFRYPRITHISIARCYLTPLV